jgi:aspartyl protease family protein
MRVVLTLVLLAASVPTWAVDSITLQALFKDKAIFLIDGTRRVLTRDEPSPEGVRLIATDTVAEQAEVEVDGKRQTVKLGMVMAGFGPRGGAPSVVLFAEPNGHFFADGLINGQPVRFMVDTGATTIAMSSVDASRIGIDYKKGKQGHASTAGGVVRMYGLRLSNVKIGDIMLYDVEAGVIEGNFPTTPLLGMSFLGKLEMKREGQQMELKQR